MGANAGSGDDAHDLRTMCSLRPTERHGLFLC